MIDDFRYDKTLERMELLRRKAFRLERGGQDGKGGMRWKQNMSTNRELYGKAGLEDVCIWKEYSNESRCLSRRHALASGDTVCKKSNVGIAIINHQCLLVYTTHLW